LGDKGLANFLSFVEEFYFFEFDENFQGRILSSGFLKLSSIDLGDNAWTLSQSEIYLSSFRRFSYF